MCTSCPRAASSEATEEPIIPEPPIPGLATMQTLIGLTRTVLTIVSISLNVVSIMLSVTASILSRTRFIADIGKLFCQKFRNKYKHCSIITSYGQTKILRDNREWRDVRADIESGQHRVALPATIRQPGGLFQDSEQHGTFA